MASSFLLGMVLSFIGMIIFANMVDAEIVNSEETGFGVAITMSVIGIFFLAFGIWWIIDGVLLHSKVQEYNDSLRTKLITEIKQGRIEDQY